VSGRSRPATLLAVSLKMYFGYEATRRWCQEVVDRVVSEAPVCRGQVDLVVFPTFATLALAVEIFGGTPVEVGAQDLFWEDYGAFTGEVSGQELREMGCRWAEIGHAERRRLFAETDATVGRKVAAAWRNGLVPLVCVGEDSEMPSPAAARACIAQLEAGLGPAADEAGAGGRDAPSAPAVRGGEIAIAYEPVWAIGAERPASAAHVRTVCRGIREWAGSSPVARGARVIYGGAAGPGLLAELAGSTDGLFLGRRAHDPGNLAAIVAEAAAAHG
jgi:triosephosphate isomerase